MTLLSLEPDLFDDTPEPTAPATHDIVHELTIAADPHEVFEALTTAPGLARWWAPVDGPLQEGAMARLPVGDGAIDVRVDLLEAPDVVQWTCVEGHREWVGTTVAFRIDRRPAELVGMDPHEARTVTVVRFWHGGWAYEDGLLPRASFEWAMLLDRLRAHLEDRGHRAA